jgi:peptidoglycan lytic transglycosylase
MRWGGVLLAVALATAVQVRAQPTQAPTTTQPPSAAPAPTCAPVAAPGASYAVPAQAAAAGAALRAALDAAAGGDLDGARALFAAAAQQHPSIADHARRLEAETLLSAGQPETAVFAAQLGIDAAPDSPIRGRLEGLLGDARLALGDEPAARAAWQSALQREPAGERRVAIRLRLGESFERAGQREAAAREYRKIWIEQPDTPEAERAGERLDALEAAGGAPLRSAHDYRRRADRLFALQHSAAALAAYESALGAGPTAADRQHAAERRAHCLFRLRRYSDAADAFAALGSDPVSRIWHARALARSDRVEESIEQLEAIGAEGRSANAVWALYLAGLLHEGRDRPERAREHFAVVAAGGGGGTLERAALWRLGWTAYLAGDRGEARTRFARLAEREPDPIERLGARYWAARALEASDPDAAAAELRALGAEFPYSYYGWLANQRAGASGTDGAKPPPLATGTRAVAPGERMRAQILLAAGLREDALAELRRLDSRAGGIADRVELAQLHAAAGDLHGAERVVVDAYGEDLARGPAPGQEQLWRLAWPAAYADRVSCPPAGTRVEPGLVWSIMREESGYQPDAISVTGALGLMQIMPATGARMARQVGLAPFESDSLLDPAVNVRLGSTYLDRLSQRFDGSLPAVIASYNAGEETVAEWLVAGPGAPDEWVEAIPYSQTRAYVKRVLRSVHVYRALYP